MDTKSSTLNKDLIRRLQEARERTRYLLSTVSDRDLAIQHDEIMSPLIWDFGHIGNYEELWLLNEAFGKTLSDRELFDIYDASLHPREERPSLDMLDWNDANTYLDAVREAAIEALRDADLGPGSGKLFRDGLVYSMVLQHEAQHNETMLQTLNMMKSGYRPEPRVELPEGNTPQDGMKRIPAGAFLMGTDNEARALDNERGAHEVYVDEFELDTVPVTNRRFIEFVEDGGYEQKHLWDPDGWNWKVDEHIHGPKHWYQPEKHDWWTQLFGFDERLDLDAPVMHVSFYEAEAYARWADKRLPTEAEWEKAASWDPTSDSKRLFPWGDSPWNGGRANLDQLAFRPARVGAYPRGASAYGVLGMIGDVWEWTDTDFHAYPGFKAFPYREYSEVFFDDGYVVLRGGSFATRPCAISNTFRNWDFPIRRQLFVGFRCAR
ncbi:ergothioneine biosynthesis protein EgtB [Rubrobacter indicoceani]|uniref:ergothioneine biosynthesis protein EgtB n=1 Tax=Rubrobacter indicoceani TaxID=2051957 RepID=UPI000E5B0940|nr:ergothioneine biosynthesis protein EgtB [Rubrobacter indicoceani]